MQLLPPSELLELLIFLKLSQLIIEIYLFVYLS